MSTPILKPNSSWFIPTVSTIKKTTITTINIVDSYTPSTTPTDSWDASVAQDGSVMCYVEGTALTIAGNGSGKIMANEDSSYMFSGMTALTSVNCGVLDTSNTTNMEYMFGHTAEMKLTSITFGNNFNTSKVKNFLGIFRNLRSITSIDVTGFDTSSATTLERMFDQCQKLQSVDCSGFDTKNVTSMYCMFQVNYVLTSVGDISGWDLSNCTSTRNMFSYCQKLGNVDVSNWNVSKVTDMKNMFQLCQLFTNLDVSKWDTSSCTDMSFMFYDCELLTKLVVDNWNVSNVITFDHMFAHCASLAEVNVSKWNVTSAATNMNAMFHSVKHTHIDVTGWDTSNVIAFAQMFEANTNLERIDGLNTLNTANGHSFSQMFSGCKKIKELDLSSFNTRTADVGYPTSTNGSTSGCTQNMFSNMHSLEKIILGENFTFAGNNVTDTTYHGILPVPSATYIDGADGNWYTADGTAYVPADVPNLTHSTYYASCNILPSVVWDRDSKKYMHLAAMREYHDLINANIVVKFDTLREEIREFEEASTEDIHALFV